MALQALLFSVLIGVQAGASLESAPTTRAADSYGRAAILHQPGMPIKGMASSAQAMARILSGVQIDSRLLSAAELADPAVLNAASFDILVLPTGESFPIEARESLIKFLREGGSLIATGGYAFNDLLTREDGQWRSETDVCHARLEEATRKENSLLHNGDFEATPALPEPGKPATDQWQRTSERCTIVEESPQEGRSCAKVTVLPGDADRGPVLWQDVPAKPGHTYRISGWLRSDKVLETGMAYIALYQYDSAGKLVTFLDFAKARGTTEWTYHTYTVKADARTARLHVKFGLYLTHGTAWFDDIRLADITGAQVKPMNTSTGTPMDALVVAPEQIGMFDPSFPLKRACRVRTASNQHIARQMVDVRQPLTGWAASGVVGNNEARWIPLLETYDRFDRPRGAAGAMLIHYAGYYNGSCRTFFGIENVDLFADPNSAASLTLADAARFMVRKTFLHGLATNHRLYRDGESIIASVQVDNRGRYPQRVKVGFTLTHGEAPAPAPAEWKEVVVRPRSSEKAEVSLPLRRVDADLYRVTALLTIDDQFIDEVSTGVVIDQPEVMKSGPELRFRQNYFTINGRPMFLFGSDTYMTYESADSNPLIWSQGHVAARDIGLNLYEDLQFVPPNYRMTDEDWRAFRAMSQLTQKHGLIFMPGMLIGQNVAIGDDLLTTQSELCRQYAEHLGDTPGLLYYVNGDYQMMLDQHPKDVQTLWNRWLKERYGTTDGLRAAWGPAAVTADIGNLAYWPPDSGRWDDVAIVDRLSFQNWLTRRWNESHVAAIRKSDARHPITSEYYQFPFGGMDLIQSIDGQDVSNFGFFDEPVKDITTLPFKIRFNDLRARGKGVCLGEYGVKTHPAWSVENGASHYHIQRTEEQQIQLFMAVAHYALGLGASKVQNWCLQDSQSMVFPWGLFYPNELIPKDVAYVHRSQSLIWRHFSPRYVPPKLTVCIPDNLRLGNFEAVGREAADRAFDTLLGLHYDFDVIDDHHLDSLPKETQVMIYPAPFAVRDDAYDRLLAWVRGGGTLLVTGDFSYDENRQRTRTRRLPELAGVEFVAECYPNISRASSPASRISDALGPMHDLLASPCIKVRKAGAEVLEQTVEQVPLFVRNTLGTGHVFFFTDPTELSESNQASALRRHLYGAFLAQTSVKPLQAEPNEPWIHVMAQPTATGMVHVVYNRKLTPGEQPITIATVAGRLTLNTRNRWPALAGVANDGRVLAVNAFGTASLGTEPLLRGKGLKALLSLDGKDIRQSEALLIAPFEAGTVAIPPGESTVAVAGEFRQGRWTPLDRIDLGKSNEALVIDADLATCLIIVCRRDAEAHWADQLTQAMLRPWQIKGY
jgi:hypothetical protein